MSAKRKEKKKKKKKKDKKEMGRPACCEKGGVKKGAWTPEEDKILVDYITKNGHGTWRSLPKLADQCGGLSCKNLFLSPNLFAIVENRGLNRCGKSCRLRWKNYLRPDIKRGPFSSEEESTIIQLRGMLGNKWAAIASHLPGRTDNEVKNFWNSHLKKQFLSTSLNQQASEQSSLVKAIDLKLESPSACHTVQWESARVEAEARLSMDPLLLNPSLVVKSECDYFLRLWNSEIGKSFRKIDDWDGVICHSPVSQTSSSTKLESGSGVTSHARHSKILSSTDTEEKLNNAKQTSGKTEAEDMALGSESSKSSDLDDSPDNVLKLLDFPKSDDIESAEGSTDDVSIYLKDEFD